MRSALLFHCIVYYQGGISTYMELTRRSRTHKAFPSGRRWSKQPQRRTEPTAHRLSWWDHSDAWRRWLACSLRSRSFSSEPSLSPFSTILHACGHILICIRWTLNGGKPLIHEKSKEGRHNRIIYREPRALFAGRRWSLRRWDGFEPEKPNEWYIWTFTTTWG